MKLLLTSNGLSNQSIAQALFDLVGKKPEDISLVFIPTAANLEFGDKEWFIDQLVDFKKQNFKCFDITDIAAVGQDVWLPKLQAADVIFFGGGSNYYLMEQINKSGLSKLLPDLLKNKVYAGLSAGSMVSNPTSDLKISQIIYKEDLDQSKTMPALNYVDFYFLPHLNNEYFQNVRENFIKDELKDMTEKIYALDDNSALKIVDGKVEIISEGEYFVIN